MSTAPVRECQPEADALRQHTPTLVMGHIVCIGPDDEEGIPYDEAVIHLEGDEDSEIRINCPGALRLAPIIVEAVNSHERLTERCEAYKGQVQAGSIEIAALKSRVEDLTKALEPFAKLAAFAIEAHRDSRPVVFGLDHVIAQRLTIGDLRAAGRAVGVPLEQEKSR